MYPTRLLTALTLFAFAFVLAACDNDDEPAPVVLTTQTVSNLAADATTPYTNKFTLFSLKDNAVVANTDSATTKWDIGFRGTTIIVNGGAVRTGQGGAYIFTGLFEDLKNIPAEAVFRQDNSTADLAVTTGSGRGWYNYNPANHLITPIPGKILVVKTADGKYAKVEILSYYKDAPANPAGTEPARYYTFRFVYQPSGSAAF